MWYWISVNQMRFPQYLALYLTKPVQKIDRFAKIDIKKTSTRKDGKYCFEFE